MNGDEDFDYSAWWERSLGNVVNFNSRDESCRICPETTGAGGDRNQGLTARESTVSKIVGQQSDLGSTVSTREEPWKGNSPCYPASDMSRSSYLSVPSHGVITLATSNYIEKPCQGYSPMRIGMPHTFPGYHAHPHPFVRGRFQGYQSYPHPSASMISGPNLYQNSQKDSRTSNEDPHMYRQYHSFPPSNPRNSYHNIAEQRAFQTYYGELSQDHTSDDRLKRTNSTQNNFSSTGGGNQVDYPPGDEQNLDEPSTAQGQAVVVVDNHSSGILNELVTPGCGKNRKRRRKALPAKNDKKKAKKKTSSPGRPSKRARTPSDHISIQHQDEGVSLCIDTDSANILHCQRRPARQMSSTNHFQGNGDTTAASSMSEELYASTSSNASSIANHSDHVMNNVNAQSVSVTTSRAKKSRRYIPKEKTRKRTTNQNNWIDVKAKKARISGKGGEGRKDKTIRPRKMDERGCSHPRCNEISHEERVAAFNSVYDLKEKRDQWEAFNNWVSYRNTSETMQAADGNDSGSSDDDVNTKYGRFQYHLPSKSSDLIPVCRKMFCTTLDVSYKQIRTAKKKLRNAGPTKVLERDQRGKHTSLRRFRVPEEVKDTARNHMRSFPTMESHFCREDSDKLYLDESIRSVSHMFRLYEKNAARIGIEQIVTKDMYHRIFNREFNYGFFIPKKDCCDQCEGFKNLTSQQKEERKEDHAKHLANKRTARNLQNQARARSEADPTVQAIHFDLQKILATPRAEIGALYYLSKICVWNFTIFAFKSNKGHCMVWNERIGKRGSNEIASFLYDYIRSQFALGVLTFLLFSDNCGGQNRNQNVFSMAIRLSIELGITITHRFLEVGHTQSAGDSVHGTIERHVKHQRIFTQAQWCEEIRNSKVDNPYDVSEKTADDIYDFSNLAKLFQWKEVGIASVREYTATSAKPLYLSFRHEFTEEPTLLRVAKKGVTVETIKACPIPKAYNRPHFLSKNKRKAIRSMIRKNIIKYEHRPWYLPMLDKEDDASDSSLNLEDIDENDSDDSVE